MISWIVQKKQMGIIRHKIKKSARDDGGKKSRITEYTEEQ